MSGVVRKRQKGQGSYVKMTLGFSDKIRILKYLEAHKERILRDRPSYEDVAAQAGRELELVISKNIIRGVANSIGMTWRPIQIRKETGKPHPRHNYYRDKINVQSKQIAALRRSLVNLCTRMGEIPPPELSDLWPVMELEDLETTESGTKASEN